MTKALSAHVHTTAGLARARYALRTQLLTRPRSAASPAPSKLPFFQAPTGEFPLLSCPSPALPTAKHTHSYGFFSALGDLLVTGPTRTNVNDYRAIVVA